MAQQELKSSKLPRQMKSRAKTISTGIVLLNGFVEFLAEAFLHHALCYQFE